MNRKLMTYSTLLLLLVSVLLNGCGDAPAAAGNTGASTGNAATGTAKVEVTQYTSFKDDNGGLYLVGIVKNNGTVKAQSTDVAADLLDADGKVAASSSDTTLLAVRLDAGKSAGFNILFSPAPDKWAKPDFKVTVTPDNPNDPKLVTDATGLSAVDDKLELDTDGRYLIYGKIKNDNSKGADTVAAIAIAYDDAGKVADVETSFVAAGTGIDAGQSSPFEIDLMRKDAKITRYELQIIGYQK